jgi:phosphoserine aminotransferase
MSPHKAGRTFNFSAGPSMLPVEILEQVQSEMLNYKGTGQSVMEMSHRSKEYLQIYNAAEKDMRDLLNIPQHYKVLNLQGGATLQFSSIPLNLLGGPGGNKCDYIVTGQWSEKSYVEAKKYGDPRAIVDMKATKYTEISDPSSWNIREDARYLYYCDNETVNGVEFQYVPDSHGVPLIADMSSNFMSRHVDVDKYAVIYAGVQKNLGPAGNTVVIVDEKYLGKYEHPMTPIYCSWKTAADAGSMYNTPSCFSIYVMGLYLKYTKERGGVKYWEELSATKSNMIYNLIDESDGFYTAPVHKSCRSRMNVPFIIDKGNETLEKKFLEEATAAGFINLAGHRSVGGLRASLYNGMPIEGVESLVDFMRKFQEKATAA